MRVLYLGAKPIGYANATGQTLECLYADHPFDSVLQIVYDPVPDLSTRPLTSLTPAVAPLDAVLRLPARHAQASRRAKVGDGLNDSIAMGDLSFAQRGWRSVRALADTSAVRLPRKLLAELRAFAPSVLHTLLGNVRMMKLAIAISDSIGIPIVPHFMDDWPATLYTSKEMGGAARRIVTRQLEAVLAVSPQLLVIGDAMAEEFENRYGKPCTVAAYGVESDILEPYQGTHGGPKKLLYIGGQHLGRGRLLQSVSEELDPALWELHVVTGQPQRPHPTVHFDAPIPEREVLPVLRRADALLFVESADPSILAYTRLSVSTKVPQYLSANRPTLVMGPEGQASVEVLRRHLRSLAFVPGPESLRPATEYLNRLPSSIPGGRLPSSFTRFEMSRSMLKVLAESGN